MLFEINEVTGLELDRADPRRKFVEALATFISLERNRAEHEIKQTLLAYAEDNMLEHKGIDTNTTRLLAKASKTEMEFILEPERVSASVIEGGTRFLIANTYFATEETQVIPLGVNVFTITAICEETGEIGNGYLPGEITTLVDPIPYVKSVRNITETTGGTDIETDDAFAERIRLAPEKFSVAGPELAYKYWALTANQDIADVEVHSPSPGTSEIIVLLKDGVMPSEEHLNQVLVVCSDKSVRPLTDNVISSAPTEILYDANIQYWISRTDATIASSIESQVTQAYEEFIVWQKSKLGRDINPSELIACLKNAGAYKINVNDMTYLEVSKIQIAKEQHVSLTFMGLTDE